MYTALSFATQSTYHHVKMKVYFASWKPVSANAIALARSSNALPTCDPNFPAIFQWGRFVLAWRATTYRQPAQLWSIKGGRSVAFNRNEPPFVLDEGYESANVIELDQAAHRAQACEPDAADVSDDIRMARESDEGWACVEIE